LSAAPGGIACPSIISPRRGRRSCRGTGGICPRRPGRGRARLLDFDGVMMVAEVFVNGRRRAAIAAATWAFPWISRLFLHAGKGAANVIAVRVDGRLHADIPPCGRVMDFQPFAGIYRGRAACALCRDATLTISSSGRRSRWRRRDRDGFRDGSQHAPGEWRGAAASNCAISGGGASPPEAPCPARCRPGARPMLRWRWRALPASGCGISRTRSATGARGAAGRRGGARQRPSPPSLFREAGLHEGSPFVSTGVR